MPMDALKEQGWLWKCFRKTGRIASNGREQNIFCHFNFTIDFLVENHLKAEQ